MCIRDRIYRGFWHKWRQDFWPEQRNFIKNGGIVIYSIQPKPEWREYADGAKDEEIIKYANAIKKVAPHKVLVFVGFEPDVYTFEGQERLRDEKPDKVKEMRGSPQDYKDMYKRFVEVFDQEKVTNVVFGVDYAWNIQYYPDLSIDLFPQNLGIKWVFHNIFQYARWGHENGKGNCEEGLRKIF